MGLLKNQEYELTIEDLGNDGEGIGHIDGMAVFVKDTVPGDVIRVRIVKVKKQYAFGRAMEIITPSPHRVTPKCVNARQCGGCTLQHVSYEAQLIYKWNKVKNCLERIGGLSNAAGIMEPVIGMFTEEEAKKLDHPLISANICANGHWHYRNKAQFPVGLDKDGHPVMGFFAGHSHTIVKAVSCDIQAEENVLILEKTGRFLEENHISIYDETKHKGLVRHVLTRVGFHSREIMVCLVLNGNVLPHADLLIQSLSEIPGMTSICININQDKTNRILGDTCKTLWGRGDITDSIGNLTYSISPLSFYQVNPVQTEKLYEKVLSYADLCGEETVWDLYCGIGTISLFLAQKAKLVMGVEIIPQAICDARKNAEQNHINNARFFVGKAEEILSAQYRQHGIYADVIVIDPPRKGCDIIVLKTMVQMAPKRIVYVSCDPATLARDLKYLCEHGYRVDKVCPVDQFGHSYHVETVCLLSKLHSKHHIEVELHMDEMDLTAAESKATYEEIKAYVLEHSGFKVSNLYIAQVKQKYGIIERECYNKPKSEDSRQPKCPPEKEAAITEALKYFKMI